MKPGSGRLTGLMFVVALTVSLVAALSIQARATYNAQVTADEPQYLITALSLGEDFDLDISDELEAERFRDFHEVNLNPQTIALDDAGLKISPHDPLLPLLLAPNETGRVGISKGHPLAHCRYHSSSNFVVGGAPIQRGDLNCGMRCHCPFLCIPPDKLWVSGVPSYAGCALCRPGSCGSYFKVV